MLGTKGKLFFAALALVAVLLTGEARLHLDKLTEPFRGVFNEMLYLPRGDSLKLLACGFDAPLADALYIKGLVYYAEALDAQEKKGATRLYTYELFDVITDLNPRFYKAYQTGGTLLGSSAVYESVMDSCRLLEKGVATWDALERKGESFSPDPRWHFHSLLASNFSLNIQNHYRNEGDFQGAAEARERASQEFRLAAASAEAPPLVIEAAAGIARSMRGHGDPEEEARAVRGVWTELREAALRRGNSEMAEDLTERIRTADAYLENFAETRGAQEFFSEVGREYLRKFGRAPDGLADLKRVGLLKALPDGLPFDNGEQKDRLLPLPDGTFMSRRFAELLTESRTGAVHDALRAYVKTHKSLPAGLDVLVSSGLLRELPALPLAAIGQEYEFDPNNGHLATRMPHGPELPPERW